MNLIIPMGGQGKRLRPHTLNKPKALLPIAGKLILERIVEEIYNSKIKINNIGFVVNDISKETKQILEKISSNINAKCKIFIQDNPLGTADAIYRAREFLQDDVLIVFSDTLFKCKLDMSNPSDGIIWSKNVKDPSAFGVIKLNKNGIITNFIEKPQTYVSSNAIIGLYYIKDGKELKNAIKHLIENNLKSQEEFQLTDALSILIEKGNNFITQNVEDWMDCGNKDAIIKTNRTILEHEENSNSKIKSSANIYNSIIIPPVFIDDYSIIHNSVIGPYVSIGQNTNIYDSRIKNSIIQDFSIIKNINLNDAMLGSYVNFIGKPTNANVGDYSNTIIN